VEQFWHPGEPVVSMSPHLVRIGTRGKLVIPAGTEFENVNQWRSTTYGAKWPATALAVRRHSVLPVTMWSALSLGPGQVELSGTTGEGATLEVDGGTITLSVDRAGRLSYTFAVSR
jgi:hypothetical protein